jgi:hypothetical protein
MSPLLEQLDALAFDRASPSEANQAIEAVRLARGGGLAPALSYELALPGLGPDEFLTQRALPKLVYFLDCRGAKLPNAPGVFVSLFTAEGLLFFDAGVLVQALATARGLTLAELVRRYGEGGVGDPPLLGT